MKKYKEISIKNAMKDWSKLIEKEKEKIYETWELTAGKRWKKDFSLLKVDELFDTLGGTELPRMLLRQRKLKKVI